MNSVVSPLLPTPTSSSHLVDHSSSVTISFSLSCSVDVLQNLEDHFGTSLWESMDFEKVDPTTTRCSLEFLTPKSDLSNLVGIAAILDSIQYHRTLWATSVSTPSSITHSPITLYSKENSPSSPECLDALVLVLTSLIPLEASSAEKLAVNILSKMAMFLKPSALAESSNLSEDSSKKSSARNSGVIPGFLLQ